MATTGTPLPSATVPSVIILSGTTTGSAETIFTPPSGKRWMLVGWQISGGSDSTNVVSLQEGSTVIRSGVAQTQVTTVINSHPWETPPGHLPYVSAVDGVLKINGTNGQLVGGQIFILVV